VPTTYCTFTIPLPPPPPSFPTHPTCSPLASALGHYVSRQPYVGVPVWGRSMHAIVFAKVHIASYHLQYLYVDFMYVQYEPYKDDRTPGKYLARDTAIDCARIEMNSVGVHSCTKYAERRSLQSFAGTGNFEFYSHALLRGSSFYNTNFRKDHYNQMLHQYCTSPTRDVFPRLRESAKLRGRKLRPPKRRRYSRRTLVIHTVRIMYQTVKGTQ
jgi:hypothetical protein